MKRYKPFKFEEYDLENDIWKSLRNMYSSKGIIIDIYNNSRNISEISLLKVPKESRGQGIAKEIMKKIIDIADKNNIVLSLTPVNEFGASKARLIDFYKSFGFVMNKGKNKNYQINNTMLREPRGSDH